MIKSYPFLIQKLVYTRVYKVYKDNNMECIMFDLNPKDNGNEEDLMEEIGSESNNKKANSSFTFSIIY